MELDNKIVGRNLAKFRMMRDMKAADFAERIGMKEHAYAKYERGESKITIPFIQKAATALKVDPISILTASPENFIESISNNSVATGGVALIGNDVDVKGNVNANDKQQQELMMKLMEKLIDLLGNNKNTERKKKPVSRTKKR
jgi:transcriptional regulator with XRE-family HTH domain